MSEILTTLTAEALALKGITKAIERLKSTESTLNSVFDELTKARQLCKEQGIVIDVEMSAGLSAAYSSYKQEQARKEARNDIVFDNGAAEETQHG